MEKKKLGEILIEMGFLTPEKLTAALQIQKKEGGLLGTILIRSQIVSEADVTIALARQNFIPYIPLAQCKPSPEAIKSVDGAFAFQYKLFPFDKIDNHLLVVFADPSNALSLLEIEKKVKMKIQVFVSMETEVLTAIKKHYKYPA